MAAASTLTNRGRNLHNFFWPPTTWNPAPGPLYDQVHVTGGLALGGALEVSLISGFTPTLNQPFDILDWGSLSGAFSSLSLPTLATDWDGNTSQLYVTGSLKVVSAALAGDFNFNGVVDAADDVAWPKGLGASHTQNCCSLPRF